MKSKEYLNSNLKNAELTQTLEKDYSMFGEIGVLEFADELTVRVGKNDNITYEVDAGEYTNNISILQNNEAGIKMIINQDEIINELIIKKDGTLFLDGNQVIFGQTEIQEISTVAVEPMSVEPINRIVATCPYGSASDYSYKLGTKNVADITLQKKIEDIAFTVFSIIICRQLNIKFMVRTVSKWLYNGVKKYNPDTKGISYKVTNYAHKNYKNTYITPIKMYGFKSKYTWYTKKNYGGTAMAKTVYQTKEIN